MAETKGCCGGPAEESDACCVKDAEAKKAGEAGCGCGGCGCGAAEPAKKER